MGNGLSVLYRDNSIIVCVKPYGVLSEEDEKKPNLPAMLKADLGCDEIYPVHRLDRTTQGLMVYAKTKEAANRLSAQIQRGEMEKTYLAVIEGVPDPLAGEYRDLLYFDRKKNKSYVVKRERKGVKQARLRYETLETIERDGQMNSLVKIILDTGRTHQIRVQFASRKMPLIGDRRYGSRVACEIILLSASQLSFIHPFTGERMTFKTDPTDGTFGLFKEERQS